jgi:Peptidase propeptide and YPEB domain
MEQQRRIVIPGRWKLLLQNQMETCGPGAIPRWSSAPGHCVVLVGGAGFASAYTGEKLAKYAKVSLPEARAIALKAFPGKITDEELEKENGGSGLRYSFDIKNGGVTHEVGIDAKTGKLLENSAEGPQAD